MRIVEPYYIITISIIITGLSLLTYMKFFLKQNNFMSIIIYGSDLQAVLFAYYLKKTDMNLNITLVGSMKPEIAKYMDLLSQSNTPTVSASYIDSRVLQFCGQQPLLMKFLEDMHLQYKIKRSQIVFCSESEINSDEEFQKKVYRIDDQIKAISTIFDYGLSHLTAISVFDGFYNHIQKGIQHSLVEEKSMRSILNLMMPEEEKPMANGLQYLSQNIGLDQRYIRDYVNPTISASYHHNVNSIATLFKMLPLFCPSRDGKGTKNLVLLLDEKILHAKLLLKLIQKSKDNFFMYNKTLIDFKKTENRQVLLSLTDQSQSYLMETDLLFIIQNYEDHSEKQSFFYKTVVDGIIQSDKKYQQVYTIYFKSKGILSITRLCSHECKSFRNYAYLVISKNKLSQKDLTMFADHQIISYKKYWVPKSQIPSSFVKFQQTTNVYRVSDSEVISDSYELKLLIIKNLVNIVTRKYKQAQQ